MYPSNPSQRASRSVLSASAAAVCALATLLAAPTPAQSLRLDVTALADSIPSCVEGELAVAIRLVNPAGLAIGGYQVYLRFPADAFELARFESTAVDAFLAVSGPGELGGFEPCATGGGDPWDDGLGEDVVAIVGSVFGEGSPDPLTDTEAELGRIVFRPRGVASGGEGARFRLNDESCHLPVEQVSRLFGASGEALDAELSPEFRVTVDDSGPQLREFFCFDAGSEVRLRWDYPEGVDHRGARIYRDGEAIAEFPAVPRIVEFVDPDPLPGLTRYAAAIRLPSDGPDPDQEGCRLSCEIDRAEPEFIRGDANLDGGVNVADPVAVLEHLFGGEPISCRDSGDADDSGSLNVTDAVTILSHLFQGGGPLAPPFPDPGPDPTSDSLDCTI